MSYFIIGFILFFLLEITLKSIIHYLRKDFQWLITSEDIIPKLSKEGLNKFFVYSYDSELGWVRKPNTSGQESKGSFGALTGHKEQTSFTINEVGARKNPGHENLPKVISTYGDSFSFCRQVNDDQTWQWYLSRLTQTNILNFGVGNYGLDQAYLRLKREYDGNKTDMVILGVVPETIVRILSVYRHYFEYGNTFAFKPKFILEGNKFRLLSNPMDKEEKYFHLEKYITQIQDNDYFYNAKFKKDMLFFPYSLSMLRNPFRNIPIVFSLIVRKIYRYMNKHFDRPWEIVLEENRKYCMRLYTQKFALDLMISILREFSKFGKEKGFIPVFLLLPYQQDIEHLREKGKSYYANLTQQASDILMTIDMAPFFLDMQESIYTNDFYGGHPNPLGNEMIAKVLYEKLWLTNCPEIKGRKKFPRLTAYAETSWTQKKKKNYEHFLSKLPSFLKRLNILGINHAKLKETE